MGSTIHHTTSYNPEANGMVERSHRTLKAALMARCTKSDWKAQLPWVLLGIRTSPKEGLQVSPAEMVFGEALTVPGEFFPSLDTPTDSEHLTKLRHAVTPHPPYRGPYAVLERNPKAYRLSIGGKSDWVSIDRLKPAYLEEKEPTPTTPLADNPAHTVPPSNAPAHPVLFQSLPFIQPVESSPDGRRQGPAASFCPVLILFSRFTPALEPRGFSRLLPSFLAGSRFRPERLQKPCTDKIFSEFGQAMACFHPDRQCPGAELGLRSFPMTGT
nr:uncharacterized protein LOC113821602 [Penaeus vannamei]